MTNLAELQTEVRRSANPKKAIILQRFFKTGKGEYGAGDKFLGLTVPQAREIARKFGDLKFAEISKLLKSKFHEERLVALLILVERYTSLERRPESKRRISRDSSPRLSSELRMTDKERYMRRDIFKFYLGHTRYINNWDLVDLSADKIVGVYLLGKDQKILYKLAKSRNVWERRIAMIATYQFIKNSQFKDTLGIARMLLKDKHDLIHKAVGWMLREVGKRSQSTLEKFLKQNYRTMPRTTLRYAIEKFPERRRLAYLKQKV